MTAIIRRFTCADQDSDCREQLSMREWLLTNGLGGYASGTVAGVATRRYHGLLIAALPAPWGRYLMMSHLVERARHPSGQQFHFNVDRSDVRNAPCSQKDPFSEFRLEMGLPVWRYEF
jgi:hypothetical protein